MTVQQKTPPVALIILDGWGHSTTIEDNAIANARTPNLDKLTQDYASGFISGSGIDVGLPDGQMGNSEVGHVNIGAGRIVYQDLTRISKAIEENTFAENKVLSTAVDDAQKNDKAVHIMGLLSPGGVHSHMDHIEAMIKMAHTRGAKKVYLHAFLDGRDVPPRSAQPVLAHFETLFSTLGCGRIASVIGRYYAMDRDHRWDRVQAAYDLLTQSKAQHHVANAQEAIESAYARDESDEFVQATRIGDAVSIEDGDSVVFMNFRADRAREITHAFIDAQFDGFTRGAYPKLAHYVMLTEYAAALKTACAFPPERLKNTLGEWLAQHEKQQLRISETEKYAHVTFFFNGGLEAQFPGEERILIPSPQVATYDLQPEMNAPALTDKLVDAIHNKDYDLIICNYPNGDMVGHTGNYDAAVKACEAVDESIGRVIEALQAVGGECIITADHGNAEKMRDPNTGQPHTAHTNLPVPFIYMGRAATVRENGRLSDLAPTLLHVLGMEKPSEMTGESLLNL